MIFLRILELRLVFKPDVLTLQQNDLSQNQKTIATTLTPVLTLQQNDLSQNFKKKDLTNKQVLTLQQNDLSQNKQI